MNNKLRFSICIPAYNRSEFLPPLLDSILSKKFESYEVVICEDYSPERKEIEKIVSHYNENYQANIRLILNDTNLGYDANIRRLVEVSSGEYCFFLGNDDLLATEALSKVNEGLGAYSNVNIVLRSYVWFTTDPSRPDELIRYFNTDKFFVGIDALRVGYRRAGVLSGFIIKRNVALDCETSIYDGTLYYQKHLALNALKTGNLLYIDKVLTLSRADIPPDFGNSEIEKDFFVPGHYSPEARLKMFGGAIKILKDQCSDTEIKVVMGDYAKHFFPYIRDQLNLPLFEYVRYCRKLASLGFGRFLTFYIYCFTCYLLGTNRFDYVAKVLRRVRGTRFFGKASISSKGINTKRL